MSIHYKFKSNLDHDTVTFDGLNISVADLKKSIMHQKKIGKSSDFDLQITNAQTKEVYDNDEMLVPKNTSVIVARVPVQGGSKKNWDKPDLPLPIDDDDLGHIRYDRIAKSADLINANTSEEDKVKAMITQSSVEYDPSKYMKSRSMTGPLPPTYTCFRCGKTGHWIKNCPTNNPDVKRSTGIPRSFMVPVDGPEHKGALLTSSGDYAVPLIDHQAYKEVKKEKPPFVPQDEPAPEPEAQIPEELLCMVCKDLLQDAVLIPCCGNSFCDECVRQVLLESDNHECPVCNESDVSPNTLIPNRFLRTAVLNFKNETGYTRVKRAAFAKASPVPEHNISPQPSPDSTVENQSQSEPASMLQSDKESTLETAIVRRENSETEVLSRPVEISETQTTVEASKFPTSEKVSTPELKMEEDSDDVQPGTPLADEPIDELEIKKPVQTLGSDTYSTHAVYDFPGHSRYSRRNDYNRHYEEDSFEPKPISTIETITNTRKSKFVTRPAPVRQQFLNQSSHPDERADPYLQEDEYRGRYDKRHRTDRSSQKNHSHYDRPPRNSRYHQSGNIHQYSDSDHSRRESHYDVPVHNEEPVRKHQERYVSPPHTMLIPSSIPPAVYPPPSVPIPPPAIIPPPQVYQPQPPPPGASPIDTSHLGAQPPPPGVGPLLPPSLSSDVTVPFTSHSYDSEDPLKDVKKKDERSIDDRMEAFQRELEKRDRERPRDRVSRSRSRSSGRHRSRSRSYSSSKSWSRSSSRSISRSPRSRSRSFSSHSRSRSYSRSRSWSKSRSYTRSRSRTRTESRSRSRSRMESRIRRREHSRERLRSPRPRTRSRSFSPKEYRIASHRNIPYTGKHGYTPPQYGGSYPTHYGPPPNILPLQVMRPPTYPPHHMHSIPPVPPIHTRPIDHYTIDRVPKYPPSYSDQYPPSYDPYPKYQHQRYDREQRSYDRNLGYDKNVRYDKRQEYDRHQEEVPHIIPGWVGERPRDYKPRYRQARDQRKEIKELPKIPENEMRILHNKESPEESSKREERKTSKSSKDREEKISVKHKKHHHHHKSKDLKKYEKIPGASNSEKDSEFSRNIKSEGNSESKENNDATDSEIRTIKSSERVKDKKHKHKKHKGNEQITKKKKSLKKEKVEGAPSTDSDLPANSKIKKKKIKLKQLPAEEQEEVQEEQIEKIPSPVVTENLKHEPDNYEITQTVSSNNAEEQSSGTNDAQETFGEEFETEVTDFISEELPESEPCEIELNISKETDIDDLGNIEETNVTDEEDEDVLRVDVPGLSKWERDSGAEEIDEEVVKPQRRSSVVVTKEETLPTEIIQKAEKVFLSHQMKPRLGTNDANNDSKDSSEVSSREMSPAKPKDSIELKSVVKTERLPSSNLRVVVSRERRSVHPRKEDSNSRDGSLSRRVKHEDKNYSSKQHNEESNRKTISQHSKASDRNREPRSRISDRRDRRYSPKRETTTNRNSSLVSRDYNKKPESDYKDDDSIRRAERRRRFSDHDSRHSKVIEHKPYERSERRRPHITSTDSKSRRQYETESMRSSDSSRRPGKNRRSRSKSSESIDSRISYKRRNERPKQVLKSSEHHSSSDVQERANKEQSESARRKHSPVKAPEKQLSSSYSKSTRRDDFDALKFEPNYDEFSDIEEKVVENKERVKRKSTSPDGSRKKLRTDKREESANRRVEKSSVTSSASESSAISASDSSDSDDQKGSKSKSSDTDHKQKHKKSRHKKHKKHKHKKKKSHKSKKE